MSDIELGAFLRAREYMPVQMEKNVVGHFEVRATINDVGCRLLLDTGASRTVVARARAEALAVATRESDARAGGVGTAQHQVALGDLRQFRIEGVEIGPMEVAVIDLEHVNQALASHGGSPIDGAIGGDVLRGGSAIIDYPAGLLYLRRP